MSGVQNMGAMQNRKLPAMRSMLTVGSGGLGGGVGLGVLMRLPINGDFGWPMAIALILVAVCVLLGFLAWLHYQSKNLRELNTGEGIAEYKAHGVEVKRITPTTK